MRQQFPLTVPLLQQAARPSRKWDDKAEVERYGVLTALLIPELAAARGAAARREVTHRLARIAIALHRHRAQHGRFPERLDELAPGSIPLVPCDPYDGQPMRLKRTERGWEIYSVGPDLADDQGRAIDWERETQTGDITFEFIEPR
jgi:type II secretory pathway pseudopilin PulG